MRLPACTIAAIIILAPAGSAHAQFHFTHRDTLPQKVVQRALDGFNHHDVVAIEDADTLADLLNDVREHRDVREIGDGRVELQR